MYNVKFLLLLVHFISSVVWFGSRQKVACGVIKNALILIYICSYTRNDFFSLDGSGRNKFTYFINTSDFKIAGPSLTHNLQWHWGSRNKL
jgi:hypothetical protein